MKILLKLYFYFAVVCSLAQETSAAIQVNYKVESFQNADLPESPEASRIIKQMKDFMEYIEFELLASNKKSIFKMKKLLSNDNAPEYISNLAIVASDGDEIWYTDTAKNLKFLVTSGFEEPTRLNYDQKEGWEITDETKRIGDLSCYKATTVRNEGSRSVEMVAWFAPELPYGFGPIGLDGLPGTILELRVDDLVYTATKIKQNTRKKIKAPKYQHEMAYKEYYRKLEEEVGAIKAGGY